jgi:hypothetical protein
MLTANSTNDINFNSPTNSRPNTNPLPHRDLLHPKVIKKKTQIIRLFQ